MKTTTTQDKALVSYIARNIRTIDKVWLDSSKVERASRRASALDMAPESRHACYPLAWALETGRASSEFEAALLAMPARKVAEIALTIAASEGSVNACWAAWKAAVAH